MSSGRPAPYPKRKPSAYAATPFYWRGGDVLREREYIEDEHKKALADFRRAELELKQLEADIAKDNETLHEREGYTDALANLLDADTEGNQAEHAYKKRLVELEARMQVAESELKEAKAVHHPAVASSLMKERAYLAIEMQRVAKAIELTREQEDADINKLSRINISARYQTSLDLETKVTILGKKSQYLRKLVNRNKKEFDQMRPVPIVQSDSARNERWALVNNIDLFYSQERTREKVSRRPSKWHYELEKKIWQISELNDRMRNLGMNEEDVVDVEALKGQYLEDVPEEEPKDE
jgi:hypothetical protein